MSYTSFRELAELTSQCAIEVDNYILDRVYDSLPFDTFKQKLMDLQLRDNETLMTMEHDPSFYIALYEVVKSPDKELKTWRDLALEMRLLRMELDTALESKDRSTLARNTLVNLSREFSTRIESIKHYAA